MNDIYSFGEWLKQRRMSLGQTQRDIALLSNCALTTIKKIEADERRPSFELAHLLAIALKIPQPYQALFVTCARGEQPITQLRRIVEVASSDQRVASEQPIPTLPIVHGEIPYLSQFHGRPQEIDRLTLWLSDDRAHVVTILGIGGQGKTALAAEVIRRFAATSDAPFACILWHSLLNALPLMDLLQSWLAIISDHAVTEVPTALEAQLQLVLYWLRERRCLLVLDNFESILQPSGEAERIGTYQSEYTQYGQLIHWIAQTEHTSSLLITSRERPKTFEVLERATPRVRSLALEGLDMVAGRAILEDHGVSAPTEPSLILVQRYSGNPLALSLVAETIRDVYQNDLNEFLDTGTPIFDDIRDVLTQQFAHLSDLEHAVLIWLALERQPISFHMVHESLWPPVPQHQVISTLRSLRRRSLLHTLASGFTLHNVVIEYVTDHVIDSIYHELAAAQPRVLASHALLRPSAEAHMLHGRVQRIVQPVIARLIANFGTNGLVAHLRTMLDHIRTQPTLAQSYAGGNLFNLLRYASAGDLRELDFSHLRIRNGDLRGMGARGINFTGAEFIDVSFTEMFGMISSVAFSADGALLAAGTVDSTISVWQLRDYQPIRKLTEHKSFVQSVTFGPHTHVLASGSTDGTVRLWNLPDDDSQALELPESRTILDVAFSSDGSTIAAASEDWLIYIWDVSSRSLRHVLNGHERRVFQVAWHPCNQTLASASEDHTIRLWDTRTKECLVVLHGHSAAVMSIAFSPDGTRLISGGRDGRICIWDVQQQCLLQSLSANTEAVRTVAISPDGQRIASAGEDYMIRLWNVTTGEGLGLLRGHTAMVTSIAFSPDGQTLASGANDWTVRLWDATRNTLRYVFHGYIDWMLSVTISPDGCTMISGGENATIYLWDLRTRKVQRQFHGHTHRINSVAYGPLGMWFASASGDRTVRIWPTNTPAIHAPVMVLRGSRGFTSVAFTADESLIAASNNDTYVYVWDTKTWQLRHKLPHGDWVNVIAFSPCGTMLVSGCHDTTITVWDVASHTHLRTLHGHREAVSAVAFNATGTMLASGGWDGSIHVWECASGTLIATLPHHQNWVRSLAFNPQGTRLASASADASIRIWDTTHGTLLQVFQRQDAFAASIVFSPDGCLLYASNSDGTITVWDLEHGACIDTLHIERPYAGMDITGVTGLTHAQKDVLKALGAMER